MPGDCIMTKKKRILLVEDETDVLRANEQYLARLGFEVHCAECLQTARAILWEYPPDLILLDVMLPDGSGFDWCREIRKSSSVPIIFLTALGEDGNVVGGLSLGGDDYIVKPYNMEIMGARVMARLRRDGTNAGTVELPPLFIDVASGLVRLEEIEVVLPRKECQLLIFFAEHQGIELDQQRIYEAIWGDAPETMGTLVRKNVSSLRKKLPLDGSGYFELANTPSKNYLFLRVKYPKAE